MIRLTKHLSNFIYFFNAAILVLIGIIVKYFLNNTNLGARFKNFNKDLYESDIIFIWAIVLIFIGFVFLAIKKSKNATLKDITIIISLILTLPTTFILVFTPFYDTFNPGEVGDTPLASFIMYLTGIGMFALFAWIVLLLVTFLKQLIIILTRKIEQK